MTESTIMVSGINAPLAALFAFGKKLSTIAGNIANTNTDGYKARIGTIKGDDADLPQVDLKTSDTPGALVQEVGVVRETSNVDLMEEIPQMMITQRSYEANIKALATQDEIFKSTIDILA